nr:hypothetical protein [Tanacetum cinerariifolium]
MKSFTVACKAYEGEHSLPLFRSLCNVRPAWDLLTLQKRHDLRDRIIRHPFEAQTFPEPILYLAGLAAHGRELLVPLRYFMMMRRSSAEHRLVQRRSIATAFEEGSSKRKQFFAAVGSSSRPEGKRRKQDATKRGSFRGSVLPYVEEAYFTHNFLSRLNCPSIQRRLDGLSFDELSNVYDDQALRLAMAGN